MAEATASTATHSAGQPGSTTHLALSELNKASVKIGGTWVVDAYRPFEDKYEYTWQGKPRQGTNFVTTLVCADDPSKYCQAHFKKTSKNGAKYEQVMKTLKPGGRFIMSKVGFLEDAKLAYVSCPGAGNTSTCQQQVFFRCEDSGWVAGPRHTESQSHAAENLF